MTDAQKLQTIKMLLGDSGIPDDNVLSTYIELAGLEILAWKYHLVGGVPDGVTQVRSTDEVAQIYAVVNGFTQAGAEGEQTHIENSVHRHFRYEDMLGYIRNHVIPYAGVGTVK